jgi:hypothetical protein
MVIILPCNASSVDFVPAYLKKKISGSYAGNNDWTQLGPDNISPRTAYLSRYKGNDHRREHQNADDGKDDLIPAHPPLLISRAIRCAFL